MHPPGRRAIARSIRSLDRVPPKPRDIWLWIITVLDDVFIGKFWYRLKRGDTRGALRSITEPIIGFPGCWLIPLAVVVLVILLVRAL
jgi:hypothetical protein